MRLEDEPQGGVRETVIAVAKKFKASSLDSTAGSKFNSLLTASCLATDSSCGYKGSDMWQLCKEFLLFLRQEKKWWLIPLVILLLVLGALIIFSSGSVLAPLMYPFM